MSCRRVPESDSPRAAAGDGEKVAPPQRARLEGWWGGEGEGEGEEECRICCGKSSSKKEEEDLFPHTTRADMAVVVLRSSISHDRSPPPLRPWWWCRYFHELAVATDRSRTVTLNPSLTPCPCPCPCPCPWSDPSYWINMRWDEMVAWCSAHLLICIGHPLRDIYIYLWDTAPLEMYNELLAGRRSPLRCLFGSLYDSC